MKNDYVIIETVAIGKHMKVTAIDTASGIEGTIIADQKMPKSHLEKMAIKKLEYVIEKRKNTKRGNSYFNEEV